MGLPERLLAWRNRLLASPRFQRWAASFPLTRAVARRQSRAVFDLLAGFIYSQVLLACVRLQLLEFLLREGPQSASAIAARTGLTASATGRLLDAAVSLKLIAVLRDGRFVLGELGAPIAGNTAIQSMVEHHALVYADLRDPVALLRGAAGETSLSRYWAYAATPNPSELADDHVGAYSDLMSASQPLVAGEILDAFDFTRHRCLLDVGGGQGTFLMTVAARHPALQLMLFDLPAVAQRATERFADAGLANRAWAVGGDFFSDALPCGADLISLVRVLHDHDDHRVMALLSATWEALPEGGTLLIAEPLSGVDGAEPVGDAYFGFYLLAMGSGRARSVQTLTGMLLETGFTRPRVVPTRLPLQTSLILAKKITR